MAHLTYDEVEMLALCTRTVRSSTNILKKPRSDYFPNGIARRQAWNFSRPRTETQLRIKIHPHPVSPPCSPGSSPCAPLPEADQEDFEPQEDSENESRYIRDLWEPAVASVLEFRNRTGPAFVPWRHAEQTKKQEEIRHDSQQPDYIPGSGPSRWLEILRAGMREGNSDLEDVTATAANEDEILRMAARNCQQRRHDKNCVALRDSYILDSETCEPDFFRREYRRSIECQILDHPNALGELMRLPPERRLSGLLYYLWPKNNARRDVRWHGHLFTRHPVRKDSRRLESAWI